MRDLGKLLIISTFYLEIILVSKNKGLKMVKKISIGLLSMFMLLGCGSDKSSKKNNLVETSAFDKSSTDIMYKAMDKFPNHVQISIAKIKDGQVHYYGALHSDGTVTTVENYANTFMIGSISKLFTSTLLAQMVLDGKVALDDNIQKRLPYTLHNDVNISYKKLSNHTSGLPREPDTALQNDPKYHEYNALDITDIEKYLKHDLALKHAQGSHHYSNLGVATLGYMMTHIENKPYEVLLQERIFNKLGMQHSTTIRANVQATLIPALMPNDDPVPPAYKSAGGILSTVEDLYRFSLASFGDEPEYLLTQKATLKIDDTTSVGLGWSIKKERGQNFYFHNGAVQGYRSVMILDKENQNGIIILSNLPIDDNLGDITNLGVSLMEEMYK